MNEISYNNAHPAVKDGARRYSDIKATSMDSFTLEEFRTFVNRFSWTFAKTYAEKCPHEYIVLGKVGAANKDEFIKAARFIRDEGFKAFYFTLEGYYFVLDENYYWTMDKRVEDTSLINRAKRSDYELVDNRWYWKKRKG